jgi:hypothetical protein
MQVKIEPTIWQNYRPLPKPEPVKEDPHASGPYIEKLAMGFLAFTVLGTLISDIVELSVKGFQLLFF